MIFSYVTLKFIWWLLVSVLIIGFAITGGMDVGATMLLPVVAKNDDERRYILNSIGPTWEGNQVWLVTFGGALFAVWPIVYATAFSSLYLVFLLVLCMLILRPPGFDYRSKITNPIWRITWDRCLFSTGVVLALVFGVAIGNLFIGFPFAFDQDFHSIYTGQLLDLFSPATLIFGMTSLCMIATHGALFLQYKLEGELAKRASKTAVFAGTGFIVTFLVTAWLVAFNIPGYKISMIADLNQDILVTHKLVQHGDTTWFTNYLNDGRLLAFPALTVIGAALAMYCSELARPALGLLLQGVAIIGALLSASVALFPFIMPSSVKPNHSLTIWDSSASHTTLEYSLYAVVLLLPIVLTYTIWVYRVMRGKVKLQENSY